MNIMWSDIGWGLAWGLLALLAFAGLLLSMVSFSGTWLVWLAGLIAKFLPGGEGIGWPLVVGGAVACAAVEAFEAAAVHWGVIASGGTAGSAWVGFAGALLGMMLGGALIPIPLIGGLAGMTIGSFGAVMWWEYRRHGRGGDAARVAAGALIARALVIALKCGVSLLLFALFLWRILQA